MSSDFIKPISQNLTIKIYQWNSIGSIIKIHTQIKPVSYSEPLRDIWKACGRSPSNWLKIEKISMGYPWDWFKSPFPWVSHGTDLSHQNPWDTHGNVLSHLSCLDILFHPFFHGTILSQVIKEYAPVTTHHQSKSLLITKPLGRQWLKMVPWVIVFHAPFHGTILSQFIQKYAPVIAHHQSTPLLITKPLTDSDLKWSHD